MNAEFQKVDKPACLQNQPSIHIALSDREGGVHQDTQRQPRIIGADDYPREKRGWLARYQAALAVMEMEVMTYPCPR